MRKKWPGVIKLAPRVARGIDEAIDSLVNPNRVEQFRTPRYDRRLLHDLRGLSYSTYVRPDAGNPNAATQQPPYLRINIGTDGNRSMEAQLYFIPANNGAIQQNVWQRWNASTVAGTSTEMTVRPTRPRSRAIWWSTLTLA